MKTKTCVSCRKPKALTEFSKCGHSSDGLHTLCHDCHRRDTRHRDAIAAWLGKTREQFRKLSYSERRQATEDWKAKYPGWTPGRLFKSVPAEKFLNDLVKREVRTETARSYLGQVWRRVTGRRKGRTVTSRPKAIIDDLKNPDGSWKQWALDKYNNNTVCQVSGLSFGRGLFKKSFDRIVPELGYTDANTQVVVLGYNWLKNIYTHAEIMLIARALVARDSNASTNI